MLQLIHVLIHVSAEKRAVCDSFPVRWRWVLSHHCFEEFGCGSRVSISASETDNFRAVVSHTIFLYNDSSWSIEMVIVFGHAIPIQSCYTVTLCCHSMRSIYWGHAIRSVNTVTQNGQWMR